jgi:hypothetical protein
VAAGDVVKLVAQNISTSQQTLFECKFIPPRMVPIPKPVEEAGIEYSTGEYFFGKPVYKQLFEGNVVQSANSGNVTNLVSGVDDIVEVNG